MNPIFLFLQSHFPFLEVHKYLLLFIATIIDGFGTFVVAGFLVSIRALAIFPTFCVLVAGDILNGVMWYWAGRIGGSRVLDWFAGRNEKSRQRVHRIKAYTGQFTGRAILLSNLTSLTTITNIFSGTIRYNWPRFMLYNTIGSFFKPTIILAAGYFYGKSYQLIFSYLNNPWIFLLSVILVVPFMWLIRSVLMAVTNQYLALWDAILHMRHKIKFEIDKLMDPTTHEDQEPR